MNKKAENFKQYLDEKNITCFAMDEANDELSTVVFRSNLEISGQQLPLLLVFDNSIYNMIRILVVPKALKEDNKAALNEAINGLNKKYKSFKYYLDDAGNLVLDCCLICTGDEVNGGLIYSIFDVVIKHLNDEYKKLMQSIWN